MSRALSFVLVAAVATAASAGSSRSNTLTGDYASNWEDVHLVQEGSHVSGTYVCCGGGTLDGRIIEGRVLKFHWHEPRGAGDGEGVWIIKPDGTLDGTWGLGQSENNGGPWKLVPHSKPAKTAQIGS